MYLKITFNVYSSQNELLILYQMDILIQLASN
jgi:hypothetical protein